MLTISSPSSCYQLVQSVLKFAKKGGIGEVGGFRHVRGAFTAYEWVWSRL